MKPVMLAGAMLILLAALFLSLGAAKFPVDRSPAAGGEIEITFIGHASLIFSFQGKVVHVDPWGKLADYKTLPKADLILITHEHPDHLDPSAIAAIRKPTTIIAANPGSAKTLAGAVAMKNGDSREFLGLKVEAVPAYNMVHMRDNGSPYHPRGEGNGYVITFGDRKVYVAGDTEDIPEMSLLSNIRIAFLPVNLPYTMTPEMLLSAAKMLHPRILYPYHTGDTDMEDVVETLQGAMGVEVRIRPMK